MLVTLKSLVPQRHRRRYRTLVRRARGLALRGDGVTCPCCGHSFRRFLPWGRPKRMNAMCPHCGALERHRFLWLYLQREKRILSTPLRLLHVAPEPTIRGHLQPLPALRYVTIDRFNDDVTARCDLHELPFADGSFDAAICYHVLEHVDDDRRCMREIHRILKPGGWAVFEVPIRRSEPRTHEDPSVTDPRERFRLFGQEDHVRRYGMDFFTRLAEAGFGVKPGRYDEVMPADLVQRHAIWPDALFAACDR
jgi:SAM-dependent methyltransferase